MKNNKDLLKRKRKTFDDFLKIDTPSKSNSETQTQETLEKTLKQISTEKITQISTEESTQTIETLSKQRLPREFYKTDVVELAKTLLGKIIIRKVGNTWVKARIVETEAYKGPDDKACHAYNNRKTERTKHFWQDGGCLYVYVVHTNTCLNIVSGDSDQPEAVLIRAVEPVDGLDKIRELRKDDTKSDKLAKLVNLTNGPGKLGQALGITLQHNKVDLCTAEDMFIIEDQGYEFEIERSTRINIDYAEEYIYKPWRFYIKGNPYVSKVKAKHVYKDD